MEEKKRVKFNFLGIIAVLTFVVMGFGTTFAFFTATMMGKAEKPISVSSVEIVMNLNIFPLYNGKEVLPTNDEDIEKAYKNQCVDAYGNGACFAYTIELENTGYPQEGIAIFNAESDKITNLKYMILDGEEEYKVLKGPTPAMGATEDEQLDGVPVTMDTEDNKLLIIVIWISNLDEPQDEEQGASFEGQVSFTATSGAKITGTMTETLRLQQS